MKTLNALTSLRAFLAWWVVLYHLIDNGFAAVALPGWLAQIKDHGYLAVDAFFILSGFILSYVYAHELHDYSWRKYGTFLALRLVRIYPVHIVTLFLMICIYLIGFNYFHYLPQDPERYSPENLLLNLVLLHAWETTASLSWNYPSWSVSTEWFAYILFPVFGLVVLRWAAGWRRVVLFGLAVAGLAVLEARHPGGTLNYYVTGSLARITCEFTIGCILYAWWKQDLQEAVPSWMGLAATGLAVLSLFGGHDTVTVICFALLIFALARRGDVLARLLDRPALVYAGEISFAVYMIHAVVQTPAIQLVRRESWAAETPASIQLAVACAVIFAAAALLYHVVEVPPRGLVKHWLKSSRPAEPRLPAQLP